MSDTAEGNAGGTDRVEDDERPTPVDDVPDWDDEYVDRVADRLMFNYDLEKDSRVGGETFTLYGEMEMRSHKQFFHPSITYAHHEAFEYVFLTNVPRPGVPDLERFVDLAHDLADDRIVPSEEHYSTEFVFVVVADGIDDRVREFVADFSDRTMLKYGYHGHYDVHLVVVDPDAEELVASPEADIVDAVRVWEKIEPDPGVFERLKRRLFG